MQHEYIILLIMYETFEILVIPWFNKQDAYSNTASAAQSAVSIERTKAGT